MPRTDVTTTFSGSWTLQSPVFTRDPDQQPGSVFYVAVQVSVSQIGTYTFTCNTEIRTNFDLYDGDFDPADPRKNLVSRDVTNNGEEPFRKTTTLQAEHIYVLVISPHLPTIIGEFSIVSSGPITIDFATSREIRFERAGKYCTDHHSSRRPIWRSIAWFVEWICRLHFFSRLRSDSDGCQIILSVYVCVCECFIWSEILIIGKSTISPDFQSLSRSSLSSLLVSFAQQVR